MALIRGRAIKWCSLIFIISAVIIGRFHAYGGSESRVIAYYFHTNFRCPSCHKIEEYTKDAIKNNFKGALDSGRLAFKVINLDNAENEHFVEDYKLYTKSVVLSLEVGGRERRYKNLDKVWQLLGDKEDFIDYIRKETQAFLDESSREEGL